ncbi:cation diffusion facilitator CzcD-associated flavoprotein CzcO [Amycolatopsis echigonensis]|uniref:Cation diffusion facilitator CzcD-associated flavoprotein CzcO n=1 Tax=Amycolatopsis echigonensis TaxID=2576905 RepID=A0A2N3WKZ2_9PSEU|nr:NAD(P)/FAD-dependent oxidoreductase [Amycolatopsis niigatensis]PKV94551.1 cation diffusion facilitator CzcD-associated flavoprotein CzcO [Amycolatopsis niigatensis]
MDAQYDAVIVGAGFGGMGAAIQLRRLGYRDLLILDREDDLGGTWHVNRYPGLAVDIPSSTYSYSFEPNPYWSRLFAPGAELKKYAEHVADKYGLRGSMRFRTVVTGATWDGSCWRVSIEGGETVTAKYLLTATGFLSQPKMPDIEGIDRFAGKVIHTTAWDDSYDLAGKRAAVIGTGATAVQLIPEIAKVAAELTVYQRTPIWVSPKPDYAVPKPLQQAFAKLPLVQRAVRLAGSSVLELMMISGVVQYRQFRGANRIAERWCRAHLYRQVRDPELRRKLTPDYSFGCKRPTFSNDYFPAFTRPHVHLETTSIERIDETGIVTADGKRTEIDTLVLATGFNLWDTNFPAIEIIGRDGKNLGKWWRDNRFQAYEGVTVPGFPNLVSLNSPYSYSGLSYFTTIECQMKHLDRLFKGMRARGADTFEVTQRANDEFLDRMKHKVGHSVFALGQCATANSYYFNQHGEATLLRPTSTISAHREAARFPLEDYSFA